ncbi:GGDEF domain-containing protein [Thermodesulforhabdus norvegica]|uniref:diguanylate cyclase n=1 Tax=Thermodesulforhabdus norvegica TaxID=39841 RepID=A0A1I4UBL0_9BACT|nr:GGDEF domain-containing protein [Thermodesulforhabdus norvegica]SFM86083.1 diguanylate cyclase (GGDEF) domain-containing protein [Thermodesulforhabdus norvegica]
MFKEKLTSKLMPRDPKQRLRVERFLLAQISYIVCWSVIMCLYMWGMFRLNFAEMICFIATCAMANGIFYAVFLTGLNRKFAEPSLTIPQIVVATIFIMLTIYFTNSQRGILLIMYFIALIFGVFQLSRRQFLLLSLFALSSYAIVITALLQRHPDVIDIKVEVLQLLVLAVVLVWFSLVGGYISEMRSRLYRMHKNLQQAYQKIEELALHDELTGIYNRRAILGYLKEEIERASRYDIPLSVSLADIDHFKSINDTYGHLVGDKILRELAAHIKGCIRSTDRVGRYGGEEFLIILPHTPISRALSCMERCRSDIEGSLFEGLRITVSFGIAALRPEDDLDSLLSRADKALYEAKNRGRNRVCHE